MFETYPGIGTYNSRRSIPMGDGGGRTFGGDRDKTLSARRILVNRFRDDPEHQVVHTFNETTPRSSVGAYAYKDFLWRAPSISKGDLSKFRLSHVSPGPGYVYARSSWDEDATYFFFKCGDRFTAHQHLDVGHFLIYKQEELAGDGGHYDEFGTTHDVNYHLRTIAHNTILVYDPARPGRGFALGPSRATTAVSITTGRITMVLSPTPPNGNASTISMTLQTCSLSKTRGRMSTLPAMARGPMRRRSSPASRGRSSLSVPPRSSSSTAFVPRNPSLRRPGCSKP
jgi:hypothetical protein